jgi:hypothetical protein
MSGPAKRCEGRVLHRRLVRDPKDLSGKKRVSRHDHMPLLPGLVQGLEQLREEHEKKQREEKKLKENEQKRQREIEGGGASS